MALISPGQLLDHTAEHSYGVPVEEIELGPQNDANRVAAA